MGVDIDPLDARQRFQGVHHSAVIRGTTIVDRRYTASVHLLETNARR